MGAVVDRTDLGCNLTCEEITYEWLESWFEGLPENRDKLMKLRAVADAARDRNVSKEDFYQWARRYGKSFRRPDSMRDLNGYWLRLEFKPDEELHKMSDGISGHYAHVRFPVDHWDSIRPLVGKTFGL